MGNGSRKPSPATDLLAKRASQTRKRDGSLGLVASWADRLTRETREHPGRSVAMAVGVGYVLGGGLFSRLTARVLGTGIRIGLRTALLPFVTEGLLVLGRKTDHSERNVKNENQ
jgi:hypothetical protein